MTQAVHTLRWAPLMLVPCATLLAGACSGTSRAPVKREEAAPATAAPPTPDTKSSPGPAPAAADITTEPPSQKQAPPALRELFPHIRADVSSKLVEFDGSVPINCHDPVTPLVYLEVVACITDTKEHESLVVTAAKPSHIHAALLAAGFQPGSPGKWKWENKKLSAIAPTGDTLDIRVRYRDGNGQEVETPITDWIINTSPAAPKFGSAAGARFVFAGSGFVKRRGQEVYDADGSGLLIGLTTFGSETIAWSEVISHEAMIAEPEWIADARKVPKIGTPVVVRIRPGR